MSSLPLRILHTVSTYPPAAGGGGATHVVRRISEGLAGRGHDVTVATSYAADRPDGYCLNGVKVRQFRVQGLFGQSVLGIYGEKESFCRYLREGPFDIVMNYAAQTWHTDLTCRCLPEMRARTVLAACGYSGLIGWRRPLYWRYFRRLPRYLAQYDRVVYHLAKYQDKLFGDRHGIGRYRVIPNGVDSAEFRAPELDFRAAYGVRTRYLLLTVGDHYRNKGHQRVLDAFARLRRDDVTLAIIGRRCAGRLRDCWEACMRASRRFGDRVLVLSGAPRSHVVAAYAAADLFLSGSYIESFALVILEAQATRTPFVAFPAGNMSEMGGGLIVGSVEEMAQQTARLLDDSGLRGQLGEAGFLTQQRHYEWDQIIPQYEALYQELAPLHPVRARSLKGRQARGPVA